MAGEARGRDYKPIIKNSFKIFFFFSVIFSLSSLVILSFYWSKQKYPYGYKIVGLANYKKFLLDSIISSSIASNQDLSILKEKLEQVDFVSSCKMYKQDKDTIVLEIEERKPLVLIFDNGQSPRLLTDDFKFVASEHLSHLNFPATRFSAEGLEFHRKSRTFLELLKILRESYPNIYKSILMIDKVGPYICFTTQPTHTKILIDERNCNDKLEVLNRIFKRKDVSNFLKNEIDLRYEGQIVLR